MTTNTILFIYVLTIAAVSAVIWAIVRTRLHKAEINNLKKYDKIRICTDVEATYLYRIDTNTHRVKVTTTIHDVNFKDIVKVI